MWLTSGMSRPGRQHGRTAASIHLTEGLKMLHCGSPDLVAVDRRSIRAMSFKGWRRYRFSAAECKTIPFLTSTLAARSQRQAFDARFGGQHPHDVLFRCSALRWSPASLDPWQDCRNCWSGCVISAAWSPKNRVCSLMGVKAKISRSDEPHGSNILSASSTTALITPLSSSLPRSKWSSSRPGVAIKNVDAPVQLRLVNEGWPSSARPRKSLPLE